MGDIRGEGLWKSNPTMVCNAKGAQICKFNPTEGPQPGANLGAYGGWSWFWQWNFDSAAPDASAFINGAALYTAADSSAKFIRVGDVKQDNRTLYYSYAHPFAQFERGGKQGAPYSMWGCTDKPPFDPAKSYPCFFRPDAKFDYFD